MAWWSSLFGRPARPDAPAAPGPAAVPPPLSPPTSPTSTSPVAVPAVPDEARPPAAVATPADEAGLDQLWVQRLLGSSGNEAIATTPGEREALLLLEAATAGNGGPVPVPRLPDVLPRLMALTRREDSSPRELAEWVARDPALVGEVVQLANSPAYRTGREISRLQDALAVLGQLGLAQLVTRVALRPIFGVTQGRFARDAGPWLWELAERVGQAAASARAGRPDAFHAYLAGTVAPVGLIHAVRLLDQRFREPAPPGSAEFCIAWWRHGRALSVLAARQWELPGEVIDALSALAGLAEHAGPVAQALRQADREARLALLDDEAGVQADAAPQGGSRSISR